MAAAWMCLMGMVVMAANERKCEGCEGRCPRTFVGKGKRTDIATANLVANIWQLKKLNAGLANPKLNTESDAEEFGKGHEFATQVFKTSWDIAGAFEKYLSSDIAAWAMAFGLGKVVKSGRGV